MLGPHGADVGAGLLGQRLLVVKAGGVQALLRVAVPGVGGGQLGSGVGLLAGQVHRLGGAVMGVGQGGGGLLQQGLPARPLVSQWFQIGVGQQPLRGAVLGGVSVGQLGLLAGQLLRGLGQRGAGGVLSAGGGVMKGLERGDAFVQLAGRVQCGRRVGLGLLGGLQLVLQSLQALLGAVVRGVGICQPGVGVAHLRGDLGGLFGQPGHVAGQGPGGLHGLHLLQGAVAVGGGQLLCLRFGQGVPSLGFVGVQGRVTLVPALPGFQGGQRRDTLIDGGLGLGALVCQQGAGVIWQRRLVGKTGFNRGPGLAFLLGPGVGALRQGAVDRAAGQGFQQRAALVVVGLQKR